MKPVNKPVHTYIIYIYINSNFKPTLFFHCYFLAVQGLQQIYWLTSWTEKARFSECVADRGHFIFWETIQLLIVFLQQNFALIQALTLKNHVLQYQKKKLRKRHHSHDWKFNTRTKFFLFFYFLVLKMIFISYSLINVKSLKGRKWYLHEIIHNFKLIIYNFFWVI